jgi:threonylcarbamoyladenosine tRNA methylthiotransferase MtaB
VPAGAAADVVILNTCTVTGAADAKSRKVLRKAQRDSPSALLIVTGCAADQAAAKLGDMGGITVVPIAEQGRIPDMLDHRMPATSRAIPGSSSQGSLRKSIVRQRAVVKIQDGCDRRCTYCAVTLARGPLRSRPVAEVIAELRMLADAGAPEVVLTGIRLDAYGVDQGDVRLADLLDATRDLAIPRLRISSLEPLGVDARLAASLAAHPAVCPHLHMCLQSGDDGILAAMGRGYTTAEYRALVAMLRAAMPGVTLSTDIIVGFPGEDETSFARTRAFIEEIGFLGLHIFPFSPRPGTVAASLPGRVSPSAVAARARELLDIERVLFSRHAASRIGLRVDVLVERAGARGNGLTRDYLRVRAPFAQADIGRYVWVRIRGMCDNCLVGLPEEVGG